MLISQGILARSDNPTEVKQNKISQHWEYNCLNLKKCDERTNELTHTQTDLCIELRSAQLIMLRNFIFLLYLKHRQPVVKLITDFCDPVQWFPRWPTWWGNLRLYCAPARPSVRAAVAGPRPHPRATSEDIGHKTRLECKATHCADIKHNKTSMNIGGV